MAFFKSDSQKSIADLPLPVQSAATEPSVAGEPPDFEAELSRLRRSYLDEPLDRSRLSGVAGSPLNFLRLTRVPRLVDELGRPSADDRVRERSLLTALHGLGLPAAFRVENRGGELHLALGIGGPAAADSMARSVAGHFPGSRLSGWDGGRLPPGSVGALVVGTPQPPADRPNDDRREFDIGALASGLRGRDWGLTIRVQPVPRRETVRVVGAAAAQVRAWSVFLREGIDASSQRGQTVSRATRRERTDRQAQLATECLELLLGRATAGESEGLWEWNGTLWAADSDTLNVAGALVQGLFGGPQGRPEPLRVVRLPKEFELQPAVDGRLVFTVDAEPLVTMIPSGHLASLVRFPRESSPGFSAMPSVGFSTATDALGSPGVSVLVGEVLDRGAGTGHSLRVPLSELASHTLVAGMTGAGKTNTCMALLKACDAEGVPFLVIEPAKTEYRSLIRDTRLGRRLQVFTLGDETTSPFRLNPFICPDGYPVATHLDYLKSVFTSSFSMYGPLPHILEEAVLRVYERRGWDLARNRNRHEGLVARHLLFPTLGDLLDAIDPVVQAIGYAEELTMDIRGALKTRLKSLLAGAKGLMLGGARSTPLETILGRPTVLELAALGDDQEKSLLMGLLLVGIYEHRQVHGSTNGRLMHLTLIEEAHRILKNVGGSTTNPEIANVAGKAVDTFNNILSEARAYGEGLIIAEQIPAKLSPDAMKNSGFKLVHRLQAADDRAATGDAMVLSHAQKQELARLPGLSAVAFGAGLSEAVVVSVPPSKPEFAHGFAPVSNSDVRVHASGFHADNRDALERFAACVQCPSKCERSQEVTELLEAPASARYRAFSRLLLAWTVGGRPDAEALESVAGSPKEAGSYCAAAHMVHRYFGERAGYYGLTPVESAALEGRLATMVSEEGWGRFDPKRFRDLWLPFLERKAMRQRAVCVECRNAICYGYEMDGTSSDVDVLDRFSRIESGSECRAFLADISTRALGASAPTLQERLGYCFFIRRYSEAGVENADGRYNHLMETFT